ncbi:MAG: hypothetical protein WCA00_14340 [Candidatus Acidiferrales bacterium]
MAGVLSEDVGQILAIFSPETEKRIHYYHLSEADSAPDAEDRLRDPMEFLHAVGAGIDLKEVSLDSQFEAALSSLDEFIRLTFKPEELLVAQRRIRPWPHPFRFSGDYWLTLD